MGETRVETVVIGAGIAGLTAAGELARAGREVVVLDKGRGVGGRLATRRGDDGARWDHGAQFFTARSPEMRERVRDWLDGGVVHEWFSRQRLAPTGEVVSGDAYPRYCGSAGMTAIAKDLAAGLEVRLSVRIETVARVGRDWRLESATGEIWWCRNLVMTAPVPQARELLQPVWQGLPAAERGLLESISYTRCLAMLLTLTGPSGLPGDGALAFPGKEPVSWLADNQAKGISGAPTVIVHGGPAYSAAHFDAADEDRLPPLLAAVEPLLASGVAAAKGHRWGYALRTTEHDADFVGLPELGLWFAGDGFCAPRVEGAFLSGLRAARRLLAGVEDHA